MQSSSGLAYEDFEIEISVGRGREYPVAVINSPAGEAHETMQFPFDELALENRLKDMKIALLQSGGKYRLALSQEEQTMQDFGKALWNALLTGEVRNRYDVSLERANREGKGLRLKLRIQDPKLAALPWEFMYEPRQNEYMCLSRNVSVVRYLEISQPIQPLAVEPPLRILGMSASPTDLRPLDIAREKQRVEEAIKSLQADSLVELTWLQGQTWRDLQEAMQTGIWHIFYFIGHGGFDNNIDEGLIALADEEGKTQRFRATHLGRLLADHRSLRLVILNSCEGARGSERDIFSGTASILVQRGIPAVLAMQYEITDRAAIEFSRAFYKALANGLPVDAAVTEARKAVSFAIENTIEWGTPVLYMRSPDGVLFNVQKKKTKEKKQKNLSALYSKGVEALAAQDWQIAIERFKEVLATDAGYQDASAKLKEAEQQLDLAKERERTLKEEEELKAKDKQLEREQRDIELREKETKEVQFKAQKEAEQQLSSAEEKERQQLEDQKKERLKKEGRKKKTYKKVLLVILVLIGVVAAYVFLAIPASPLSVSVTESPNPVAASGTSQVTLHVIASEGTPVSGVSVRVSTTGGNLVLAAGTTDTNGDFKSTYIAPSTNGTYKIAAIASKIGYISGSSSDQIIVNDVNPVTIPTPTPTPMLTAAPILKISQASFKFDNISAGERNMKAVSISNIGGGILEWSLSTNESWIELNKMSGFDNGSIFITVDSANLNPGNYIGTVMLTSNGGNEQVTIEINVKSPTPTPTPAPVLTTITVSPTTASLVVGGTQIFMATTLDQYDNSIGAAVTWSSSNLAVGTIDASGKFTTLAAGTTTITVASGSVRGTATVKVTLPQGNITVIYPNGGETWNRGQTYTIRWTSQNIGSNVMILLKGEPSGSGGWFTVTANTPNTGSYQYTVPNDIGYVQYKIYVETLDGSVQGVSNSVFYIPMTGQGISTPTQLSPSDGSVFSNYPRTTTLTWSNISGAASYTVEIQYCSPAGCADWATSYPLVNVTATSYTFDFVGAQPGRWRVWAFDANGNTSPKSGWWGFKYTT
jgi:hypothetical protein